MSPEPQSFRSLQDWRYAWVAANIVFEKKPEISPELPASAKKIRLGDEKQGKFDWTEGDPRLATALCVSNDVEDAWS